MEGLTTVSVHCLWCGKPHEFDVDADGFDDWYSGRKSIQEALPDLTPSQREMLISRICDNCFPKDEDE